MATHNWEGTQSWNFSLGMEGFIPQTLRPAPERNDCPEHLALKPMKLGVTCGCGQVRDILKNPYADSPMGYMSHALSAILQRTCVSQREILHIPRDPIFVATTLVTWLRRPEELHSWVPLDYHNQRDISWQTTTPKALHS